MVNVNDPNPQLVRNALQALKWLNMGRLETITHADWHLAFYCYSFTLRLVCLSPDSHSLGRRSIRSLLVRLPPWTLLYFFLAAKQISLRRIQVSVVVVRRIVALFFGVPRAGDSINVTVISIIGWWRFLRACESRLLGKIVLVVGLKNIFRAMVPRSGAKIGRGMVEEGLSLKEAQKRVLLIVHGQLLYS